MAGTFSCDVRPGRFATNKFCAARRSRCLAEPDKQVFQLTASRQNLTYDDIWCAHELEMFYSNVVDPPNGYDIFRFSTPRHSGATPVPSLPPPLVIRFERKNGSEVGAFTAKNACRVASETCDLLSGHNRGECYASFGVDSERLDMYLGKALCLEAIFKASGEDGDVGAAGPVAAVQALVSVPVQSAAFAKERLAFLVGALGKLSNDLKKSAELMFN